MTTIAEYVKKRIKLTRRLTSAVVVILSLIALFHPLGLPLTIGPITRDYYNTIEALPEGSVVAFPGGIPLKDYASKRDICRATLYHLAQRKAKMILYSFDPEAPQVWVAMRTYSDIEGKYGYKYGVDFVIFPFLPGGEPALATVAGDMQVFSTDIYGTPIGSIPLMRNLRTAADVRLIVIWATELVFPAQVIRQWDAKYGVKALDMQYYASIATWYGTYVVGCLDGSRGAAEYEKLTGFLGEQISMVDITNLVGIWVLMLVALGNIEYFLKRQKKENIQKVGGKV